MNYVYITLFFQHSRGIVQTFTKPWNQLRYPRVTEVCRLPLEPHHDFFLHLIIIVVKHFSQRDVPLSEETSGNRWARGPDCTADGPIYPTWIFPEAQWWHITFSSPKFADRLRSPPASIKGLLGPFSGGTAAEVLFFINVHIVVFLFDNVIYVFLLLWLCILIVCLYSCIPVW